MKQGSGFGRLSVRKRNLSHEYVHVDLNYILGVHAQSLT